MAKRAASRVAKKVAAAVVTKVAATVARKATLAMGKKRAEAKAKKELAPLEVEIAQARAPSPVRDLSDDEVEISGVWGKVRYSESDPDAEIKEIFGHYDRDRSGSIKASELARLLEALGMEMEEHDLKVAVLDIDKDGDGNISWDEFLGWWRSMGR
jgi:hypothetical protein